MKSLNLLIIVFIAFVFIKCTVENNNIGIMNCNKSKPEIPKTDTTIPDIYKSVKICNQVWMTKNLNVDHYRNGDSIPEVKDPTQWSNLTTGAWCYYNNDTAIGAIYGKLYNWYAVNDPRGLAPAGWHVPSDAEWTELENCLGDSIVAGGKMKEIGTNHWFSPNTGATNESGFSALPGGWRNEIGIFEHLGTNVDWWSSSKKNATYAWDRDISYDHSDIAKFSYLMTVGFSVRCIKN